MKNTFASYSTFSDLPAQKCMQIANFVKITQNQLLINLILLQPVKQHWFRRSGREREQLPYMGAQLSAGSINRVSL